MAAPPAPHVRSASKRSTWMRKNMSRSHLALALFMSLVFGAGWVLGKTATAHFSPILVAMFRFGFAGVVLVTLFGWPKIALCQLWVASACALAVPYSFSYIGLSQLDVSVTVLLVQMEAPILLALSASLLREIPSRAGIVGIFSLFWGWFWWLEPQLQKAGTSRSQWS